MLIQLIQKKKLIISIISAIFLLFWILSLIFGHGENKTLAMVLFLILPYGFLLLLFKIIRYKASVKVLNCFIYFFLIAGALVAVIDTVEFITAFPNGLNPTLGCSIGLIGACLDEAEKNIVN